MYVCVCVCTSAVRNLMVRLWFGLLVVGFKGVGLSNGSLFGYVWLWFISIRKNDECIDLVI